MAEPGVKNFLAQQQEVSRKVLNISIATTGTFPTLQNIKDELNAQMRKYQAETEHLWSRRVDETVTLSTNTADYSMIDNVRKVIRISDKTGKTRLRFKPRPKYEREYPEGTTNAPTGQPSMWTYIDPDSDNTLKIRVIPTPTADQNGNTLAISYYKRHVDLSDDSDVSDIIVEEQDIPLYRTIAEMFTMLDDHENASFWDAKAERLARKAWKERMNQPDHVDTWTDMAEDEGGTPWPVRDR